MHIQSFSRIFSYSLLPNVLKFDKCNFLCYYAAIRVNSLQMFGNKPVGPNLKYQTHVYLTLKRSVRKFIDPKGWVRR
jgi:hypothetical protein